MRLVKLEGSFKQPQACRHMMHAGVLLSLSNILPPTEREEMLSDAIRTSMLLLEFLLRQ